MTQAKQPPRFRHIYTVALALCALLAAVGLIVDGPAAVWQGLQTICFTEDILITDYVALAGVGAALVNSALVTAASVALMLLTGAPAGAATCSTLGLVSGFALFGKDILNIWPIILGSLLYARFRGKPLHTYLNIGLMATCLAPVVSHLWFSVSGWHGVLSGTLAGLLIGFALPILASHAVGLIRGMNLYNVGFSCGLTALILVPILVAAGCAPTTVLIWGTGYNLLFSSLLLPLCALAVMAGVVLCGGLKQAWDGYGALLRSTGCPSDFLSAHGAGPVLINMGLCGLLSTLYILLIGGDLNGATVGSILTIVGFCANGKHLRSILSLLTGVVLAGVLLPGFSLTDPAIQFSALFCSTLAPLAGTFGFSAGALAGFIHICLVQRTGAPVCGLNLYNNGFTGGIVAMVLYPFLVELYPHRVLKK